MRENLLALVLVFLLANGVKLLPRWRGTPARCAMPIAQGIDRDVRTFPHRHWQVARRPSTATIVQSKSRWPGSMVVIAEPPSVFKMPLAWVIKLPSAALNASLLPAAASASTSRHAADTASTSNSRRWCRLDCVNANGFIRRCSMSDRDNGWGVSSAFSVTTVVTDTVAVFARCFRTRAAFSARTSSMLFLPVAMLTNS